jgi:hypothetical protein
MSVDNATGKPGEFETKSQPLPDEIPSHPLGPYFGEYDESGVDLSLLRWFLQLDPIQRLLLMERHARDTQLLNEYGRKHREAKTAPGC